MQPRLATPLRRPAQPLVLVHCHARLQPHRQEGTKQGQQHFSPHLTGSILCVAAAVTVQAGPSRLPLAATPPLFTGLAAARCCTHRPPPAPPPPPLPAPRSPTATLHVSSNQWTVDHHTSRHRPTRIQSQSSINTLPTAAACRHRRTRALSLFVCPLPSPPPLADATPSWWQLSQAAFGSGAIAALVRGTGPAPCLRLLADRCIAAFPAPRAARVRWLAHSVLSGLSCPPLLAATPRLGSLLPFAVLDSR